MMGKEFIKHLNKCSERVSKWPKWKREIMGKIFKIDPDKCRVRIKC